MSTRRDSTTDKRQKNQYRLAFPEESRGAAPMAFEGGTEAELAKRKAESPTSEQWMEEVCERENCKQALRRVKANKGSPGIDGMTVEELSGHLKEHWPVIREQLFNGTYTPQPVKRVEIPKPDGGVRKLGIPTVLDRFIQQAVMQVLQRSWDGTFSEHSYRFRPKRSAHQAVEITTDCSRRLPNGAGAMENERVMSSVTRLLTTKLKLRVNSEKSAVARPWERKFLGFSFTNHKPPKRRLAPKAVARFKERVRELTSRTRGISLEWSMT
jgi:Reverse transcriptase (RNA-dependent DNA polymerase)